MRREIAARALADATPPYKPKQDAKDYLRRFFQSSLVRFRQKPHVGRLVAAELTRNPLLSLIFAERMGATIESLSKNPDVIRPLELLASRWAGLILLETGDWALGKPEVVQSQIQARLYWASSTEFPTLKKAPHKLGALLGKRSEAPYVEKVAAAAAAAFITDLAKGGI